MGGGQQVLKECLQVAGRHRGVLEGELVWRTNVHVLVEVGWIRALTVDRGGARVHGAGQEMDTGFILCVNWWSGQFWRGGCGALVL